MDIKDAKIGARVRFRHTGDLGTIVAIRDGEHTVLPRIRVDWDEGQWSEWEPQYLELLEDEPDA